MGDCHVRGVALDALSQADLDRWIADGSAARRRIRSFVSWSARRGYVSADLEVPVARTERYTRPPMDAEERWQQAHRLLHDDGLDPADRVVGILVLLYAQPLARIARLTLDAVYDGADGMTISFGRDRLAVPAPLDELLRQLPWRRQIGPSGMVVDADRWLFPGRQAGRHIHPEHLRRRLAGLGIATRPARLAALLQLPREVPAAVLADMLNIHETTAAGWGARAGGTWNSYAARRVRDPAAGDGT